MARSGFLEVSELVRAGDPCPICRRPAPGEGREHAVCRVSREHERTDELGRVWLNPRGLWAHCFRVSDPRVPAPGGEGVYEASENPGKEGTFYTLKGDDGKTPTRLLRRSDGSPASPKGTGARRGESGRRGGALSVRQGRTSLPSGAGERGTAPEEPPLNRLETEWTAPELTEQQARRRAQARELWADATPMGLALEYLASRGIDRAWLKRDWPGALAFRTLVYHAEAGRELPAMLCRVTAPDGGHAATHRIYLRADGRGKAEGATKTKALLGSPLGGAVRLYDPAPPGLAEGVLFLCEGVETAMAIAQAVRGEGSAERSELAGAGVWSCLSSSGLVGAVIPSALVRSGIVARVVIAADVDRSGGGQKAAERAADRLRREYPGLRVGIAWPGMGVMTRWDGELGHCVPGRG